MQLVDQPTQLHITEHYISEFDNDDDDDNNNVSSSYRRHGVLLPKKNIRAIFVGGSNSGKTTALMSLIYDDEGVKFNNLYIFSKSLYQAKYQILSQVMETIPDIGYFPCSDSECVPSVDEVKPGSLMIFDDVANEAVRKQLRSYFTMGRHRDIDIFLLFQSYAQIEKGLVRGNANMLLIFRQDNASLKYIFDEHVSPDMKFDDFCKMCSLAWNDRPYGCLMIDKESDIDDGRYRVGFHTYIKQ